MMIIVVLMFSVCWLPQNIYFIVTTYYPAVNTHPYIQEIYLGIYWLAMSNSMYNPIIYCIYSDRWVNKFIFILSYDATAAEIEERMCAEFYGLSDW